MKTQFRYNLPIESNFILEIKEKAPAHKLEFSKINPKIYFDITNAIDFICQLNTPIKAALSGEVIKIQHNDKKCNSYISDLNQDEEDGNYIILKHEFNNKIEFSIYSHLNKILVKKGDFVNTGDIIGQSGDSGWSILPHLHFMVFVFGSPFPSEQSLEINWNK